MGTRNKKKSYFVFSLTVVLVMSNLFLVWAATSPATRAGKPYYEGKVLTFVAGFGAGGGTDILGRLLARHLGKFIPGKPHIIVRNMPGANGMIGANYVYKTAKPDGLTAFVSSESNVVANIIRPKGVEHYFERMHPVYSQPSGQVAVIKSGFIKEPKEIIKVKGLSFGHTSQLGGGGGGFLWAKEVLGFEVERWVWGYSASSDASMAFITGEISSQATSSLSYNAVLKPYVERGMAMTLFQTGILDATGNIVKDPAAPDIPTVLELYQQVYGKAPSGHVWEAYKLVAGSGTYGKALLLPKDTPSEIVDIWNKATVDMVRDPKFIEDAERLNPGSPRWTEKDIARAYPAGVAGPPEVIQFMRKVLTEKYGVVFD